MELIQYLPNFYYNSEEVKNIQYSLGIENDKLQRAIMDLLDQLFVNSATWGLEYWEKYLGLEVDRGETLENRRGRVMTRLRGQGTTTKAMIKNICRSFTGGEVEVIEDSSNYRFIIKFIDIKGVPGNIDYLASSIEEIKPAHLGFSFEYTYTVWDNLRPKTWGELSSKTWDEL